MYLDEQVGFIKLII